MGVRRDVARAARKMPNIAPSVPPMSSTASIIEYKTSKMDPVLAIPESRSLMISKEGCVRMRIVEWGEEGMGRSYLCLLQTLLLRSRHLP